MENIVARWKKAKVFNAETNRFKEKKFILTPLDNYHLKGLSLKEMYPYLIADIYNRYEKMCGKNVMLGLMFLEDNDSFNFLEDYHLLAKDVFNNYLNTLDNVGVGYDENKVFHLTDNTITFIEEKLIDLYNKEIKVVKGKAFFDSLGIKMYNFYEVKQVEDRFYKDEEEVFLNDASYLALALDKHKEEIDSIINEEFLNDSLKEVLREKLGYYEYLVLNLNNYKDGLSLKISLEEPELLGGLNFLILNPTLMDVKPFITLDEEKSVNHYLENGYQEGIFTGSILNNPLTGLDIFIFISYDFNEAIHIPKPSKNDIDRHYANYFGMDIVETINNNVLINSDFLDGLAKEDGRKVLMETFQSEGMAEILHDYKVKELILSSPLKTGIPIPLKEDGLNDYEGIAKELLPIKFNLKGEVECIYDLALFKGSISKDFIYFIYHELIEKLDASPLTLKKQEFIDDALYLAREDNVFNDYFFPSLYHLISGKKTKEEYIFLNTSLSSKKVIDLYNELDKHFVDDILGSKKADAYRMFSLFDQEEIDFQTALLKITKYEQILDVIKSFYHKGFVEENEAIDRSLYELVKKANEMLAASDLKKYVENLMTYYFQVLSHEKMTANQALIYLKLLSIVCPFMSQELFEEVFNQTYFLVYEDWPFLK